MESRIVGVLGCDAYEQLKNGGLIPPGFGTPAGDLRHTTLLLEEETNWRNQIFVATDTAARGNIGRDTRQLNEDTNWQSAVHTFPIAFTPSRPEQPQVLFPPCVGSSAIPPVNRFINREDPKQMLLHVDGACLDNGKTNPKAGWAVVFGPESAGVKRVVSGRLEARGPSGQPNLQTSNRAELRAVLAALCFRRWDGEGFNSVVFATDSEYVAVGATTWIHKWIRNGWKNSSGAPVKNKDLWEAVLAQIEFFHGKGVKTQFWRIPRALNAEADRAAKQAASVSQTPEDYAEVFGVLV